MRSSPDADEELMRKIAQGDILAFETLVEKHQKSLINVIYRFVGDRAEAEDLAQEVFIRVYRSAKRYKPQGRFLTWFYRIAKNLSLNELKRRKKAEVLSLEDRPPVRTAVPPGTEGTRLEERLVVGESTPEILLVKRERDRLILETLTSLPGNQRMAIILKIYQGMSYQEIAEILGCSVRAVDSLIWRAKANLRKRLSKYFKGE